MSTTNYYNEIQAVFMGLADRPAAASGDSYWNGIAASSGAAYATQQIGQGLIGSGALTTAQLTTDITNIFQNLLNWTLQSGGLTYWENYYNQQMTDFNLNSGQALGKMVTAIYNDVQSYTSGSPYIDQKTYLNNVVQNAQTWTQNNPTLAYSPSTETTFNAAGTGIETQSLPLNTFSFTTGQDNLTPSGNSVTTGLVDTTTNTTFQSFDSLKATGTNNTLKLAVTGTKAATNSLSTGVTISGVQTADIVNSANLGTSATKAFSTAGWTGLTTLNVTSTATDYLQAAATTDVKVTENNGIVTVVGGDTVTVNTSSTKGVTIGNTKGTASPAGAVTINDTAAKGAINVYGGTNVTITSSGNGIINVGDSATVAPSGSVKVTDTGYANINIAGGASSVINENSATHATGTIAVSGVTGSNSVTVNNYLTTGNNAITVNGGTGATIVTDGGMGINVGTGTKVAGNVSITDNNSGPNADNITAYATGSVIIHTTQDTGTITVGKFGTLADDPKSAVTIINESNGMYGTGQAVVYTDGATSVSITGGGSDSSITDATATAGKDSLAKVSLDGYQGDITATSTALTTVNISNSDTANTAATALTVDNSTTKHTLAINLSGDTATATSVTDDKAATINVTATGNASNYIALTNTAAKTAYSLDNLGTGTLNLHSITDASATKATITVSGSGPVNLGDLQTNTHLTSISASTGQSGNISVELAANYGTTGVSFTGGSGDNTVTLTPGSTSTNGVRGVINGGTGSHNTLVLTANANDFKYDYLQNGGLIENFQNLELKGASVTGNYYGGGFKDLSVAGLTLAQVSAGNGNSVTFTNVANDTPISVLSQAQTSEAEYTLTQTATTTAGQWTAKIDGVSHTVTVATGAGNTATAGAAAIAADFTGNKAISGVTVTNIDGAVNITGAATASVTAVGADSTVTNSNAISGVVTDTLATATGTGNTLPITLNTSTAKVGVSSVIQEAGNQTITIDSVKDASNNINTINIGDGSSTSNANMANTLNVTGNGKLSVNYVYDSGLAKDALTVINASLASGSVNVTGVQGATSGMNITGGSGYLTAYGSGLASGENPSSYLKAKDVITSGSGGANITIGYGGANGNSGSETINLLASTGVSDTIIVGPDTTYGDYATVKGFTVSPSSVVSDILNYSEGDAKTVIATETTVHTVNSQSYTVSNGVVDFVTSGLTLAQETLDVKDILALPTTPVNEVAAFTYSGNTYVIASNYTHGTKSTTSVITLDGVTGITQLGGGTAASGNIESANIIGSNYGSVGAGSHDLTGYSMATVTGVTTKAVTLSHLAPSADVTISTTGSATKFVLSTTQTGAAGSNSMTLNIEHAFDAKTISVVGDNLLAINVTDSAAIGTLSDSGNTLSSLSITGTKALSINAISDNALSTINVADTGTVNLGTGTGIKSLSQSDLQVTISGNAAATDNIYLSGADDKITASAVTHSLTLSATGAGSTILGGTGAGIDKITVGANGIVTLAASNTAANSITVGLNSSVTLGKDDGGSTVNVTGDKAGSALTGMTTITDTNMINHNLAINYGINDTTTVNPTAVNVGSASSLTAALNIAASASAEIGDSSSHLYADWFQFEGNSYIVEHVGTNSAATGLSASDIVVKLVGNHVSGISESANGVIHVI